MSAVAVPISAEDPLAEAVKTYIDAKRAEDAATAARVAAEQRILALHPAQTEGAHTFEASGFKVTVTGKLNYRCADPMSLAEACAAANVPANWVPVKTKVELDAAGAKWLRQNEPDLWARVIAPHVTVEPAKTAVSVKV